MENWIIWVNVITLLVLAFSFIGGLINGVARSLLSLIALIIALPVAGLLYLKLANVLTLLPSKDWQNFVGFLVTAGVISAILNLIFLLPRRAIEKVWKKGVLSRLIGGLLAGFSAVISIVVFVLVVQAYPVVGWLEQLFTDSLVPSWLVAHFGFIQILLPEVFRGTIAASIAFLM